MSKTGDSSLKLQLTWLNGPRDVDEVGVKGRNPAQRRDVQRLWWSTGFDSRFVGRDRVWQLLKLSVDLKNIFVVNVFQVERV